MQTLNFQSELRALFNNTVGEKLILRTDSNIKPFYQSKFERNKNRIGFIDCEFMPSTDEEVEKIILHYDVKHWGNGRLNQILENYGYSTEWENEALASIWKDSEAPPAPAPPAAPQNKNFNVSNIELMATA